MKLVYIEWQDACSNAEWFTKEQLEDWGKTENWIVREVGWLMEENSKYIILAGAWTPGSEWRDEKFGKVIQIPKTWIKKRKVIKI